MRYHTVLRVGAALLAAAVTMPVAAFQPQLLQHRPITKKLPGNFKPATDVWQIVHLSRVPTALVSIDTTKPDCAFGTYPTSPNGLVTFDGTLYARLDCQWSGIINLIEGDRIDLSPVFAHGFRIDHIVFKDLAAPNHGDGWDRQPGRIWAAGAASYPLTTTTMLFGASKVAPWNGGGNDHVLSVEPPRYRKQTNSGTHMTDEYRIDIYVVGPAGIDPYTGKSITKTVIN